MKRSCSNCSLWKTDNTETGKAACPHAPTAAEGFCADHRAAPIPKCGDCTWLHYPKRNKTCWATGRAGSPNKGGKCHEWSSICNKFKRKNIAFADPEQDAYENNSSLPLSSVVWNDETAVVLRHKQRGPGYGLLVSFHGNGFKVQPVRVDSFGRVSSVPDIAHLSKDNPLEAPLVNATVGSVFAAGGRLGDEICPINLGKTGVVVFAPTESEEDQERSESSAGAKRKAEKPVTPAMARAVEAYNLLTKAGTPPEDAIATAASRTRNAMNLGVSESIKIMAALKAMFLKDK